MSKNNLSGHASIIEELESKIGYTFKDKRKLLLAITHSSYANEKRNEALQSNERIEFLGDAVLNIVTSEYIYNHFSQLPEGEMTKLRASIVCESSLAKCAVRINLGDYLLLGKGEEHTGGRSRPSILSDAFEALIGAIFLDGGIKEAGNFVLKIMNDMLKDLKNNDTFTDYKTEFQEIVQKGGEQKISYHIIEEKGPDHNKLFVVELSLNNRALGTGEGKSKKEAEQNAAKAALIKLQGESIET
jgi:ribonuclease-3